MPRVTKRGWHAPTEAAVPARSLRTSPCQLHRTSLEQMPVPMGRWEKSLINNLAFLHSRETEAPEADDCISITDAKRVSGRAGY